MIVAHRPSVLAHVDKILVLRNGQVDAFGSRNEIMKLISRPRAVPKTDPGRSGSKRAGPREGSAGMTPISR